jgi:hypothetical protein
VAMRALGSRMGCDGRPAGRLRSALRRRVPSLASSSLRPPTGPWVLG